MAKMKKERMKRKRWDKKSKLNNHRIHRMETDFLRNAS